MTKLNWLRLSATSLLLAGLSAGPAAASDQSLRPSAICAGNRVNVDDYFFFDNRGAAQNQSTLNPVGISCGLGQDTVLDGNDDIYVYFNDRNATAFHNIWCDVYEVNSDFSMIISVGVKYGCSTGGGCTSESSTYSGENYLSFANIQHGGDFSTNAFCAIARKNSSGQASFLKTIYLDVQ